MASVPHRHESVGLRRARADRPWPPGRRSQCVGRVDEVDEPKSIEVPVAPVGPVGQSAPWRPWSPGAGRAGYRPSPRSRPSPGRADVALDALRAGRAVAPWPGLPWRPVEP